MQDLAPDLVLHGGQIYTLDAEGTIATALAAKDGRIVAIGDDGQVQALSSPSTQQLDLKGQAAIPGIFDSHNHLLEVGEKLAQIRLDECSSLRR